MNLREYCIAVLDQLDKTEDINEEIRLLKVLRVVITEQIDKRIDQVIK